MSLLHQLYFGVIYINGFKQKVDLLYIYIFQVKLRNSVLFYDGSLGEVKQNTGTSCILYYPVGAWLVFNTKAEKSTIPAGNMILIAI